MIHNKIDCISCPFKNQCAMFTKWSIGSYCISLKRFFEMEYEEENCLSYKHSNINNKKFKLILNNDSTLKRQIDVTGTWNSKRDSRTFKMFLTQIGSNVYGSYEYFEGKLFGVLSGDILEGTWKQSNGIGRFILKFTADGILFLGTWGLNDDMSNGGAWSGTKALSPTINVTGLWNTTFNKMRLQQSGNTVVGTYELKNGKITGTLIGNTLLGNWSQDENNDGIPEAIGKIQITFSSINEFKGTWGYNESYSDGGIWSGEKLSTTGSALLEPITSFEKIDTNGTWNSDFGTLVIKQIGNTLSGNYEFRNGKIDGTLVGNTASGTWYEDTNNNGIYDALGKFRFVFSPNATSFKGTWGYKDKFYDGGIWNGVKIK